MLHACLVYDSSHAEHTRAHTLEHGVFFLARTRRVVSDGRVNTTNRAQVNNTARRKHVCSISLRSREFVQTRRRRSALPFPFNNSARVVRQFIPFTIQRSVANFSPSRSHHVLFSSPFALGSWLPDRVRAHFVCACVWLVRVCVCVRHLCECMWRSVLARFHTCAPRKSR